MCNPSATKRSRTSTNFTSLVSKTSAAANYAIVAYERIFQVAQFDNINTDDKPYPALAFGKHATLSYVLVTNCPR